MADPIVCIAIPFESTLCTSIQLPSSGSAIASRGEGNCMIMHHTSTKCQNPMATLTNKKCSSQCHSNQRQHSKQITKPPRNFGKRMGRHITPRDMTHLARDLDQSSQSWVKAHTTRQSSKLHTPLSFLHKRTLTHECKYPKLKITVARI